MSTKHLPELRELYPEERKYTYSQSNQIESQTGLIGHMRADFGSGSAFFTRWEPHVWDEELNKEDFKTDFDRLINCLRNNMFKLLQAGLAESAHFTGCQRNSLCRSERQRAVPCCRRRRYCCDRG